MSFVVQPDLPQASVTDDADGAVEGSVIIGWFASIIFRFEVVIVEKSPQKQSDALRFSFFRDTGV